MVRPALFTETQDEPVAHDGVESTLYVHRDQVYDLVACKHFFDIVDQGGHQVCRRPLRERSGLLRVQDAEVNSRPS
jgi:hypothetical protein